MALSALFCGMLLLRFDSLRSRLVIAGLAVAQLFPLVFWVWIFAAGG